MASSSKRKTTFAKLQRESALRERRAQKQAKKAARKAAASADTNQSAGDAVPTTEDRNSLGAS